MSLIRDCVFIFSTVSTDTEFFQISKGLAVTFSTQSYTTFFKKSFFEISDSFTPLKLKLIICRVLDKVTDSEKERGTRESISFLNKNNPENSRFKPLQTILVTSFAIPSGLKAKTLVLYRL